MLQGYKLELSPLDNRLIGLALEQIPILAFAASAVRQFRIMLKRKRGDLFPAWLRKMEQSECETLKNSAINMSGDLDAIVAAMSLDWSNGQL